MAVRNSSCKRWLDKQENNFALFTRMEGKAGRRTTSDMPVSSPRNTLNTSASVAARKMIGV